MAYREIASVIKNVMQSAISKRVSMFLNCGIDYYFMRGSFQIKTRHESIITDKGLRALVMEKLLNSSFERAALINIDEKTVEVRLEGDAEQIKKFKQELEREVIAKFSNPVITFTEFKEDLLLEIPRIMRASQALLVGQLSKGIGVQLQILGAMQRMSAKIDGGFRNVSERLDSLPERIAKAIKEN